MPDTKLSIKASTDDSVTVAGWGVVFGGVDLYGDYFDGKTNFWLKELGSQKPFLFDHGFDDAVGARVLGTCSIEPKDDGLWVEAQLNKHDRYVQQLQKLVEAGVVGLSSGAVGHLVATEQLGTCTYIKSWPVAEMSATVTPAEPRTLGVQQLRALVDHADTLKDLLDQEAPLTGQGREAEGTSEPDPPPAVLSTSIPTEEISMTTPTIDQAALDGLAKSISESFASTLDLKIKTALDPIQATLAALEAEPAALKAGFVSDDGGARDKNVKSFADYLIAVRRGDTERLTKVYGVKAALAEDGGVTGGFLVPTEFVARLLAAAGESAIVRPRAYIQPMTARDLQIPALDQQTAPTAGNSAFFGGVQMQWVGEGGAYTETEPRFRMIELVAHKLQGFALASNEMLADSAIALEALLTRLFGQALGWYEDFAFLNGTGAGQPLGIKNAAALINVARNTASQVKTVDLGNMLSKMLPSSYRSAVWIAHPYTIPQLVQLALANATVVSWIPNLRENIPATLLGLPVIFSEKMQPLGTAFDLALVDLSYYVVGDRQQITIAASEHFKFTNGQVTWRVDERVDGQPWVKSAITLADATSTVSPFVGLQ